MAACSPVSRAPLASPHCLKPAPERGTWYGGAGWTLGGRAAGLPAASDRLRDRPWGAPGVEGEEAGDRGQAGPRCWQEMRAPWSQQVLNPTAQAPYSSSWGAV